MDNEKIKNIVVISIYSFPYGLAPTNRILAYSKGIVENGAKVTVYIPFPTDKKDFTKNKLPEIGDFNDINYIFTSGRYKSKIKILRCIADLTGFRKLKGYISFLIRIYKNHRKQAIDCFIISTDYIPSLFVFAMIAKFINAKSVFIFDEYPIPIRHKLKSRIPKWKEHSYKIVLKLVDGYISISNALEIYYKQLCFKKTFILSAITDVSRFNIPTKKVINNMLVEYICYMGNMELSKDNVDIIIKAFSLISEKYPYLQLHLYGNPQQNTINILDSIIEDLNLKDKVLFKGLANYNDVPYILNCAKILVSSQPDTLRASGGFPTKLGEYLASGVPVLMTDVGENAKFVIDGVHIFFSKPGDYKAYSEKLLYILENYTKAKNIALNGKEYLHKNFSPKKKGYEILEFLKKI